MDLECSQMRMRAVVVGKIPGWLCSGGGKRERGKEGEQSREATADCGRGKQAPGEDEGGRGGGRKRSAATETAEGPIEAPTAWRETEGERRKRMILRTEKGLRNVFDEIDEFDF